MLKFDTICILDECLRFFLDPWDPFCPKDLGYPREFKNSAIMLKFGTLVDKMNLNLTFFIL